jgi:hypothetical protein
MTHFHQNHQEVYSNETKSTYDYPGERKTAATGGGSLQISGNETILINYQYSQFQQRQLIQAALDDALEKYGDFDRTEDSIFDWNTISGLLHQLSAAAAASSQPLNTNSCRESFEHDTYGRTFIVKLLKRDAPLKCLQEALHIFPNAIDNSPAAFFTACHASTPEIAGHMMHHLVNKNKGKKECLYPWIFSPFITFDAAQAILQAFPEGVRYNPSPSCSSFLSSNQEEYCPLTYIFFSQRMIERRDFDQLLWQKIKLILIVASAAEDSETTPGAGVFPIHTILEQMLARPGKIRRRDHSEINFKR